MLGVLSGHYPMFCGLRSSPSSGSENHLRIGPAKIRAVIATSSSYPRPTSSPSFAPTHASSSFQRAFFRSNFAGNFSLCVHNELCIRKLGTTRRNPASAQHALPRNSFGERTLQHLQSEEDFADRVCLQTHDYKDFREKVRGNRGIAPM